ncbi:ANTAR domain-containing protein [Actinomadura fulvescens]|uniref:ANTAR domain-containing protein n=1 Tax=Actinomadura fulvescens TaxID=46160 RepID=A0ABN3Q3D8_9ACTN
MNTEPESQFEADPEAGAESGFEQALLPAQIHQAAGMVAVHLDTTIQDAYHRLESYARSSGRDLDDIASDVVGRRLRIESP